MKLRRNLPRKSKIRQRQLKNLRKRAELDLNHNKEKKIIKQLKMKLNQQHQSQNCLSRK
jgi:pyrroloquinoline quinone (PQQ) biosynthesis protein C